MVIDNLVNGKRENLAAIPSERMRLVVGDVRDPQAFHNELRAAHTVFHLACLGVRHSLHSPRENHEVNATGTLAMLEAARAAGVPRFVQVSSSEVYGSAIASPMDENHPTCPSTVYGAAKLAGEAYARVYGESPGMAVTIVRPFNAYGPRCHHEGDAGEVIPKFVLRALAGRPLIVFGEGPQRATSPMSRIPPRGSPQPRAATPPSVRPSTSAAGCRCGLSISPRRSAALWNARCALCTRPRVRAMLARSAPTRAGPRACSASGLRSRSKTDSNDWLLVMVCSEKRQARCSPKRSRTTGCRVRSIAMSADRRFIPMHRPDLGAPECEAAARVIRSGWVSQGAQVEAFEREFAFCVGSAHAVAVSSGTAALELALRALEIGPGHEVITVSHSFVATANAIRTVGARPVFVDVHPDTLTIDPEKIEAGLGPATRAILAVHQVGMPCDLTAILAIARRHGLVVIEDAACAIGWKS